MISIAPVPLAKQKNWAWAVDLPLPPTHIKPKGRGLLIFGYCIAPQPGLEPGSFWNHPDALPTELLVLVDRSRTCDLIGVNDALYQLS